MRHVLITAGTKGLGRMVAQRFLKNGYSVTVNYRSDQQGADDMGKEWQNDLNRLQFVKGDVTNADDLDHLFGETLSRFGRIDCLINNAGPFVFERKQTVDYEDSEWLEILHGNLSSVFRMAKRVIPVMRKQHFGRIITYGFQNAGDAPGWLNRGPFAAAKVGLASLTRTLALEEAENGITANMVCPGNILSGMKEATILKAREQAENQTPFGRSVTGEDIARAIVFLCQDESEMITGSVMDLTGGVDVINRFRARYDGND